MPFAVNLTGSSLFYWSLGHQPLSLVVPITKALENLFTALTSWYLGDVRLSPAFFAGMLCISAGTALCMSAGR